MLDLKLLLVEMFKATFAAAAQNHSMEYSLYLILRLLQQASLLSLH
jgi:hypothetical protein